LKNIPTKRGLETYCKLQTTLDAQANSPYRYKLSLGSLL